MVPAPIVAEHFVLPRRHSGQLADDVTSGPKEVMGMLEHGMWMDHMFEDVIHGDDVVSSDMVGQVGCLEGAFEDVIAPGPALCGDIRLDLNACTFQVEESTEAVEMSQSPVPTSKMRPGRR